MRAKLVMAAVVIAAIFAAVTSSGAATTIDAANAPGFVVVTCGDATSDAATLQNAIDSSPPGAVIDIQGGTCLLTRGISLPGDRTYTGGNSAGTVLKQAARMSYVLAAAAYVDNSPATGDPLTIRDLTVACDGSGRTDGMIILNWQADVEHTDVTGCGGSGIVDTNTTANGTAITNTSVNSRFDNNMISDSGRDGFEVRDSRNAVTDGYLDDNQIAGSGRDGIHLANAAGWQISGNHLYRDGQDGIYADRLFGTSISGNYIEDFGAKQTSGSWYGIAATARGIGSALQGNKVFNDGGEAPGATYVYIFVAAAGGGTCYAAVTGNVVLGTRPSDVGFLFSPGSGRLVVASGGNEVGGVGTARRAAAGVTLNNGM